MKTYYENTCLGCDLLHTKQCSHYHKNNYPGHYKNFSSPYGNKPQLYSHQYVELRNGMYEGTMSNFKREGLGIFYGDEGFFCIGNWQQDYLEGKAIIFFLNGGYLYANFTNNKINGLGILKLSNSTLIAGVWKDNNLEGTAFHHYPERCLWIQCEYRKGQLIEYVKEERYGPNFEESNIIKDKNSLEVRLPKIIDQYYDIKNMIWSIFKENFLQNIIEEMKINVRGNFSEFKMISLIPINKLSYLGFSENNNLNGLGVLYDDQFNISSCGYFKGGFLDGIGRINYNNGDIYEGLIKKKEFQIGIYYTNETNIFEFGIFHENKCNKAYKTGEGFPSELIKKFKSILHKKHIKFSDKYFDLTNNFNVFSDFPSDEPEHDQIKQSTEQLKKIEISPASFLEEERLFRLKTSSHTKENHTQNIGYMDSPTLKLNALKQLPKNYLDTTYERNPKNSNKIKMKENFDLFPMNISKQPITENLNWFKYNNKTSDFYDKNIQTYTVTSHNNNISGKTLQKYSKKNFYLNEEIVHLTPAKNRKHPIPKSSQKNFCYYIEEQHLNEFHQMGFKKQLKPAFNEEDLLENKPLSPHKRSVSLAAPLKKDSIIVDDLSGYSIPKFKEIQQNEKKLNNLFPNNKKKQDWNEILSKSALDKNKKAEKRSYMIYSINDPNHLKNKDNQIIDCLVYDFDRKTKENNFDLKKKVKKNIFDPM